MPRSKEGVQKKTKIQRRNTKKYKEAKGLRITGDPFVFFFCVFFLWTLKLCIFSLDLGILVLGSSSRHLGSLFSHSFLHQRLNNFLQFLNSFFQLGKIPTHGLAS